MSYEVGGGVKLPLKLAFSFLVTIYRAFYDYRLLLVHGQTINKLKETVTEYRGLPARNSFLLLFSFYFMTLFHDAYGKHK